MSHSVTVKDVVKNYGEFYAVNHINLEIKNGEFFTLLGPSGCGKTTLLRMMAGFADIDGGEIRFGDKVINRIPAHQRNIGMVFQNYAVFPHMTVENNVAYGLKARRMRAAELAERVRNGLELMQIDAMKDRSPSQLSGGQQQRVALARAIVIHPDLLLMDEPLSNLDAKLRLEMRSSIRKLQQSLGITTIYVTHDQEEALAVSDRIAVMKSGRVAQVDSPDVIYKNPANRFVAGFVGSNNFIPGTATADGFDILGKVRFQAPLKNGHRGNILVAVRPEQIGVVPAEKGGMLARVKTVTFLGSHYEYEAVLDNDQVVNINQYARQVEKVYAQGDDIGLEFSVDHLNVFTADGEEALL